jgi:hypothetical protein
LRWLGLETGLPGFKTRGKQLKIGRRKKRRKKKKKNKKKKKKKEKEKKKRRRTLFVRRAARTARTDARSAKNFLAFFSYPFLN